MKEITRNMEDLAVQEETGDDQEDAAITEDATQIIDNIGMKLEVNPAELMVENLEEKSVGKF